MKLSKLSFIFSAVLLLIVALAPDTLPDKAITLLAILTATACMWVFHLTSPVTPPLFALSCAILLDVASPGVMTAVERLAAADLRSVNAQLEILLREALARRGVTPAADAPEADDT